jgi:hypothetical protein
VTGTVVNENGAPLEGVTVSVVSAPTVSARTDRNGRFTLVGVPTGAQNLQFVEQGSSPVYVRIEADQTTLDPNPVIIVAGFLGPPAPPDFG